LPGDKSLHGRIAVVTGASRGIGRAIALQLAAEGAAVCLVGRDTQALEEVARLSSPAATAVASYRIDLTRDEEIEGLVGDLTQDFGRVDILVHSAGIMCLGPIGQTPVAELDDQYQANVRAPYLLTQALLPMLAASQGEVVFVNSSIVFTNRAEVGQYAATKYALQALADSLRDEVNSQGIRVLSVYPGQTNTPRQETKYARLGMPFHPDRFIQPDDVAAVVLSALRLPRTVEVTDVRMRPFRK
jgi:NAD(P)-dependent dehydrogenase (short-subunit alcohol dehydrogenase family)